MSDTPYPLNKRGGWIIPDVAFVVAAEIPALSEVGDRTTFGDETKFGDETTFGDRTKFGDETTIEGVKDARIICLSNVDGSGRQVQIITNGVETKVRAGCFVGTVAEFTKRALDEGKAYYAAIVPAAAAALIATMTETRA